MPWLAQSDNLRSGGCFDPVFALDGHTPSVHNLCNSLPHLSRMLGVGQKLLHEDIPSEKLLMASMFLCDARNANVTSGEPSRIIKCTVMRLLKTTVHVESRRRFCSDRKTSATPCSPECVAMRICSMYFVFGGAGWYGYQISDYPRCICDLIAQHTLIFVAPLTDFSKELAMLSPVHRSGSGAQA